MGAQTAAADSLAAHRSSLGCSVTDILAAATATALAAVAVVAAPNAAEVLDRPTAHPTAHAAKANSASANNNVLRLDDVLWQVQPPPTPVAGPCRQPERYTPGLVLQSEAAGVPSTHIKHVLELSETFSAPTIGAPECPSVGSVGHKLGLCKPCDFIHRGSCRTGPACKFCHLCEPAENRRRRKEKQRYLRAMRDMQATSLTN